MLVMKLAPAFVVVLAVACGKPPAQRPGDMSTNTPPSPTPSTPAPSESAVPVVEEAGAPSPVSSPFPEPAMQKNPNDLAWLTQMVDTLANQPATREDVIAYLGQDGGADDSRSGARKVKPRSPYLSAITVYALAHVKIEVAMDIVFGNDKPTRSLLQSVLGPLQSMPAKPDAIGSGPTFAFYKEGKHGTVRVFIEFDAKNDQKAVSLHVDVDGVKK
jgi:hypothetical protein